MMHPENPAMRRRQILVSGLVPFGSLLLGAAPARANGTTPAEPWARRPLLEGRMSIELPSAATSEAVPSSLMAPAVPLSVASRHVVPGQRGPVLFSPRELFATSRLPGPALQARYLELKRAELSADDLSTELQTDPEDGTLVVLRPRARTRAHGASLLAAALYRRPDASLLELLVLADMDPAALSADDEALVRRAIGSVRSGPRSLPDGQGVVVPNVPMTIDVPAGMAAWGQQGPDFWVAHLVVLADLGERRSSLLAYLGQHPGAPTAPASHTAEPRTPLGITAQWKIWQPAAQAFAAEVFLRHDSLKGQTAHLLVRATSERNRTRLCDAADTARIKLGT